MDEAAAEVHLRTHADTWGDSGPGAEVRWAESDADALGYAVAAAADTGVLLMLSRSQDGGALMVAIMDDGVSKRRWFHSVPDAVSAIEAIPNHVGASTASRPPRPGGRNARGKR